MITLATLNILSMASHLHQPQLCNNPKSEDWSLFKKQLENFFIIIEAPEAKRLPILLNCIGRDEYNVTKASRNRKQRILLQYNVLMIF